MAVGKVYFVGAGPGDPGLVTLKGVKALERADVVVYDRLVPIQLLKHARPEARFIYCGKEAGMHTMPQEAINEIIVHEAKEGQSVVRLKGGDPSIFGRVGEEAEACVEQRVPYEVIPGVTSGIAAAIYAGIPLTHRDYSSNVAFISGHQCESNRSDEINWPAFAGMDTLVVYMGVQQLHRICEQLLYHGKSSDTLAALVRWGTTGEQQTLTGTLSTMADKARKAQFHAPAILVIGEVVRLRETLNWYENQPLFGRKVLLFGNSHSVEEHADSLTVLGAETAEVPFRPKIAAQYIDALLNRGGFDTLWVSDLRGLSVLQEAAMMREDWAEQLRSIPEMICVGEQTATRAKELGWNVSTTVEEGAA